MKKRGKMIFDKVKEWMLCIVIAIIIAVVINKFVIYKVKIPSKSMEPTISIGDQLLVKRIYNYDKIKRGDILVFYSRENESNYIKRVVGLPGDKVEIKNGVVYVNEELQIENYVSDLDVNDSAIYEVPQGSYFFLGDNRPNSDDSTEWDNPFVDKKDIIFILLTLIVILPIAYKQYGNIDNIKYYTTDAREHYNVSKLFYQNDTLLINTDSYQGFMPFTYANEGIIYKILAH